MIEKIFKRASWSDMIISLVFIIFGFFLVTNPNAVTTMLSVILGGIFVAFGVFKTIEYISGGKQDSYLLGIGSVGILAGIIIMFATGVILSLFRIIIGIWILYTGIMNLQTCIAWKNYKSRLWLTTLIGALLTVIAGIYIIANNGAILETIGVIIIAYGIVDIIERVIFMKNIDNYLTK